jgi:hypothetical protein
MADSKGNCNGKGTRLSFWRGRETRLLHALQRRDAPGAGRVFPTALTPAPFPLEPPAQAAPFKVQQLAIQDPNDQHTGQPLEEPVVEALPTPTATEVEASLQQELERLARQQQQQTPPPPPQGH